MIVRAIVFIYTFWSFLSMRGACIFV